MKIIFKKNFQLDKSEIDFSRSHGTESDFDNEPDIELSDLSVVKISDEIFSLYFCSENHKYLEFSESSISNYLEDNVLDYGCFSMEISIEEKYYNKKSKSLFPPYYYTLNLIPETKEEAGFWDSKTSILPLKWAYSILFIKLDVFEKHSLETKIADKVKINKAYEVKL